MKYQDIREAFKKCGVIVGKEGISLLFPTFDEPQFTTVSVDDDEIGNKRVFEELLCMCDSVRIIFNPGNPVIFRFCMILPVEYDTVFQPIKREISSEEIDRIITDGPRRYDPDFAKVFQDVDLSNDDGVLAGVSEYLQIKSDNKVFSFDHLRSWPEVLKSAREFYAENKMGNISVENPDAFSDYGCAIFDSVSAEYMVFDIPPDKKQSLIDMVSTANWLSLEGFSSNEYAEFILTVYS